ncbi:hypothetical protein [Prosthecobacter sp.]|uniref:hypothetical protein n=1 Tax=Prosthecobacter sp. TaxID=1965333 RepID=UPI003784054C
MKTHELNAAGNATTNPSSLRRLLLDAANGLCQQGARPRDRHDGRWAEQTNGMKERLQQLFNQRTFVAPAGQEETPACCSYAHLISGVLPPWLGISRSQTIEVEMR